jgi:hypothetical protein
VYRHYASFIYYNLLIDKLNVTVEYHRCYSHLYYGCFGVPVRSYIMQVALIIIISSDLLRELFLNLSPSTEYCIADMSMIIKCRVILTIFTLESHPTIKYPTIRRNLFWGKAYVLICVSAY